MNTDKLMITLRSGAVGLAATAVDLLALTALVELAHFAPNIANIPALIAGLAAQFAGNKWFAFRDHSPNLARQGALFIAVELLALALNAFLFDRAVALTPLPYLVARVATQMLVYFGFSLPLWNRIFTPDFRRS